MLDGKSSYKTICIIWNDGTSTTYSIRPSTTTSLSGDWLTLESACPQGSEEFRKIRVRVGSIRDYRE